MKLTIMKYLANFITVCIIITRAHGSPFSKPFSPASRQIESKDRKCGYKLGDCCSNVLPEDRKSISDCNPGLMCGHVYPSPKASRKCMPAWHYDDNGPSLGALGRKLYAPSYVPWTEYFNVNPMLMAQIQAGIKAENKLKPNQKIKKLLKEHMSLGMLGSKLYAPSDVSWSDLFQGNPMLMAQIQAGMKLENRQNPNQHIKRLLDYNHGKRTEIIDYLPNSYYQTRVQRYYEPPHSPRGFHGQRYNLLYKYRYYYG